MNSSLPIIGQSSVPTVFHEQVPLSKGQRAGLTLAGLGFLAGVSVGIVKPTIEGWAPLLSVFLPITLGSLLYIWSTYAGTIPQIMNDGIVTRSIQNRGRIAYVLGVMITVFYCTLYWRPEYLVGLYSTLTPLSQLLNGGAADQWFMYGFVYTLAMLIMGARMYFRYRDNAYQKARTFSVVFFQVAFAFLLPSFLKKLNQPEFYFTYFWPLKPEYLFPDSVHTLIQSGEAVGVFMVTWGAASFFVLTPILTYRFGKRWYCSWVCGCGGLAETLGDPWRHLSDKSNDTWRLERWSVHLTLLLVTVVTCLVWINSWLGGELLGAFSNAASRWYGFFVGAVLSGVVGVGFYPLMGSRVWCRFFCPMAAALGLWQRFFSRFRITTNGGQCISCGNCSTYCEMGIDVRSYAQRGENIVRASCVGCGVCSAVCPRGVLKLESGPTSKDRFEGAAHPVREFMKSLKT